MMFKLWKILLTGTYHIIIVLDEVEWGILGRHENILYLLYENQDYSIESVIGMDSIVDIFNVGVFIIIDGSFT